MFQNVNFFQKKLKLPDFEVLKTNVAELTTQNNFYHPLTHAKG